MTQQEENQRLGIVVSGSLNKGVEVKLDSSASIEDIAVGRFVTIEGQKRRFFGMITDVSLGLIDQKLALTPPDVSDPFIAEVLTGTSTFGALHVSPTLAIGGDVATLLEGPQPVKTVPSHFSVVNLASQRDVELVFGKEDKERFWIGNPLDMETKICLDLPELVKRSNGIFGKSGTGKTFFTRMLLIGMLQKSNAVNLIFDMHNEYGWEGSSEEGQRKVKALKQLFPSNVAVFTLDEESSRRRGVSTDFVVRISYDEIEPEDIVLLRQTLNLTEPAVETVHRMHRRFGKNWLQNTLALKDAEEIKELLKELDIHESTFQNLKRGLATIRRLPFIEPHAPTNAVRGILEHLDRGMNVVLEFGRYRDITAYVLVANMLARRIYAQYQERMEKAMAENTAPPTPLVITIEEAHRFLDSQAASQTIFGTIAREMRKYNVTLLVIDQRPSGIDDEVMSQIGTKIAFHLDNERDIDSVLAGVSGKSELKSVLSKLESKQQALIFGHAVPVPVVVRMREYGSAESYKGFIPREEAEAGKQAEKDIEELWE
ncbi:MAG: ATP-binding protein [Dehalococcoidales bacterium]|nr:ATP-binding protein [Dehalococcoidales bacterium]